MCSGVVLTANQSVHPQDWKNEGMSPVLAVSTPQPVFRPCSSALAETTRLNRDETTSLPHRPRPLDHLEFSEYIPVERIVDVELDPVEAAYATLKVFGEFMEY